jgi:hypothetical protein
MFVHENPFFGDLPDIGSGKVPEIALVAGEIIRPAIGIMEHLRDDI